METISQSKNIKYNTPHKNDVIDSFKSRKSRKSEPPKVEDTTWAIVRIQKFVKKFLKKKE